MPFTSKAQAGAMFAAKEGNSNIGIPASVGKDFVNASHGMSVSSLPQRAGPSSSIEAATGLPSGKTHRGKRSRGKGPKVASPQTHLASINASMKSGDHAAAKHSALMLANALHKAQQQALPVEPDQDETMRGM